MYNFVFVKYAVHPVLHNCLMARSEPEARCGKIYTYVAVDVSDGMLR